MYRGGFANERPPSADGGGRVSMSTRELPPFRCMGSLTRALRFCRWDFLSLDRATLCCRNTLYRTGFRVGIAKRFVTPGRGRIIAKNLSTPIHFEQSATVPIGIYPCASVLICGSRIESPDTEPLACESGTGQTLNNQTHEPPSERADEVCHSIDALVTRRFSVNEEDQPCLRD